MDETEKHDVSSRDAYRLLCLLLL